MTEQFVVFNLGEELYAANINEILEVRLVEKITRVPGASPYLKGMMNLRGKVIPVFDIAEKMGVNTKGRKYKKILIAEVDNKTLGMLVTEVQGVERFDSIEEVPELLTQGDEKSYIRGIYRKDDQLIIILSIGGLFPQ
jgi:purine-binding chemotaxis protein CheW